MNIRIIIWCIAEAAGLGEGGGAEEDMLITMLYTCARARYPNLPPRCNKEYDVASSCQRRRSGDRATIAWASLRYFGNAPLGHH